VTEDGAIAWIAARWGDARTSKLRRYAELVTTAASAQNLVAPSTLSTIWSRHIADSAQLLNFAPAKWTHWVDVGSGAGLPGIIVAALSDNNVSLIEPRQLRATFLRECLHYLDLDNATVVHAKAGAAAIPPADVVSARAVASTGQLFTMSHPFATKDTTFILPKGKSAQSEVADVRRQWHGMFHVEQSIVDPASGIIVATGVARR